MSGVAFPELQLEGEVVHIDSQASSSQSIGLPLFPVSIHIKKLTKREKDIIKVGMSAKIKLSISIPGMLEVPINAVYLKDDAAHVQKYVEGEKVETRIITGRTSEKAVEIISGIKEGDEIVISD